MSLPSLCNSQMRSLLLLLLCLSLLAFVTGAEPAPALSALHYVGPVHGSEIIVALPMQLSYGQSAHLCCSRLALRSAGVN